MNVKIVYADIFKTAWKGFKSQCWLLMGLLIGFTIIYSLLLLFAIPAKEETLSISSMIVAVISIVLASLFIMGYLKNCLQTIDGEEPQFLAYGQVLRKLLIFIPASLIFFVTIAIGCAFLLFPGIYLYLRFQFFFASMMDEDSGMIESFKRSWSITKGHAMQLFVLLLFQKVIIIIGFIALGIGIFAAIPYIILMYGYAYRKLTAPVTG